MGKSAFGERNNNGLKKGPWTADEDKKLIDYIQNHGQGRWRTLPANAGLKRCGKSCRLRWTNYLRPDIKRGRFSFEEEEAIIQLHSVLGNKWSAIAAQLPGRTDNEIKNFWNTHIKKRLLRMGIDPVTHSPRFDLYDLPAILSSYLYTNYSHSVTGNPNTLDAGHTVDPTLCQQLLQNQLLQENLHANSAGERHFSPNPNFFSSPNSLPTFWEAYKGDILHTQQPMKIAESSSSASATVPNHGFHGSFPFDDDPYSSGDNLFHSNNLEKVQTISIGSSLSSPILSHSSPSLNGGTSAAYRSGHEEEERDYRFNGSTYNASSMQNNVVTNPYYVADEEFANARFPIFR